MLTDSVGIGRKQESSVVLYLIKMFGRAIRMKNYKLGGVL